MGDVFWPLFWILVLIAGAALLFLLARPGRHRFFMDRMASALERLDRADSAFAAMTEEERAVAARGYREMCAALFPAAPHLAAAMDETTARAVWERHFAAASNDDLDAWLIRADAGRRDGDDKSDASVAWEAAYDAIELQLLFRAAPARDKAEAAEGAASAIAMLGRLAAAAP